jgi:endonuclease YncB( thermonuclease family)
VALWGLFLNALPCSAEMLHGKVVGVADGDTLTLLSPDHIQTRIRLFGIDAPEKSQAFGQRSKASLSDLVFGRDVDVIVQTLDRYGRTVGRVSHKGNDINLEQVRQGMAWILPKIFERLEIS